MKAPLRWSILGAALVATLAAAAFSPDKNEAAGSSKARRNVGPRVASAPERALPVLAGASTRDEAGADLRFPARPPAVEETAAPDLFAAKSWYVAPPPPPPPPPVKAAAPPKPVAPALPFTFMGRLGGTSGEAIVYLVKGDRTFPVKGGEVIEGVYRVEKVDANQVEFTYIPLDEKQVLAIGAPR